MLAYDVHAKEISQLDSLDGDSTVLQGLSLPPRLILHMHRSRPEMGLGCQSCAP